MEIIHIVLGKANPNRMNGVNKVVYQLATEQVKAGKDIQVWGISQNLNHDYPERNFVTQLFMASRFPFFISKTLKIEILAHKEAVFHLHGGWIPVFSSLANFFSKHNIKYVLTPHGAYNEVAMQKNYFIKKLYFQLFEKQLLNSVYKVHSIGATEVKGLAQISPNTASFLLPYGFENGTPKTRSSNTNDFVIGFVGRLDVYTKGLDILLESFYHFQKSKPHAKLWIIGDGEGRAFLENFIKEKNLNNVILWGKKFGQEKEDLISKMHVFAHPSRNEGLPTAVLEAAVHGTPTIVTEATNVAEYVGRYKAGIAIGNNNIHELIGAMTSLYSAYLNGEAIQYMTGAARMLKEIFSWPVLVEKYEELYK